MWYIIRHGQTLENNLGIQQGQTQSLLTLKGIVQAQSIGYRLLEQNEDFLKFKFISSPLVRARHTLQIIMEILGVSGKIEPIVEPLIINRSKGILQGIPKEKVKELFPEEYEEREKDPWNYIAPGATESKCQSCKRLQEFIEKYKNEENLIMVGHRGINSMIRQLLDGLTPDEIKEAEIKPDKSQNYFYTWDRKKLNRI